MEDKMLGGINDSTEKFRKLIVSQLERNKKMKACKNFVDFTGLDKTVIGICGGDGIGPVITKESQRVLEYLLSDEIKRGSVEFKIIDGLTIENRIKAGKAIPDDVLQELKECHCILKGPTTTPNADSGMPNIESANVAMRRELDLFANVRPVKVPEKGIDWTFFRENTEGSYALGSLGVNVDEEVSFDFTVTTTEGSERIARRAYEFARKNGKKSVAIVTKANVIKTTDGKFLNICKKVASEYPEITTTDWYIDIMTANLINEKRQSDFQVIVLPNLYGDIITDEAAQMQGGVGTAGSANIGKRHAMFEAIHGSAPRMVEEGRAAYADPCSMLRASAMLLNHIGRAKQSELLNRALDKCMFEEKKFSVTGRSDGATCEEFGNYVLEMVERIK